MTAPQSPVPQEVKQALEAAGQSERRRRGAHGRRTSSSARTRPTPRRARRWPGATIKGYYVVPPDYIAKGVVDVYTQDTINVSGSEARNAFSNLIRERLMSGRAGRG